MIYLEEKDLLYFMESRFKRNNNDRMLEIETWMAKVFVVVLDCFSNDFAVSPTI